MSDQNEFSAVKVESSDKTLRRQDVQPARLPQKQQAPIARLQSTAGNQAVSRVLGSAPVVSQREELIHNLGLAVEARAYLDVVTLLDQFTDGEILNWLRGIPQEAWKPVRDAAIESGPGPGRRIARLVDTVQVEAQERERVRRLNEAFASAVLMRDWPQAAIHLNGFNDHDIAIKLNSLGASSIEAIAAASPSYRVARIARAMLPDAAPRVSSETPPVKSDSTRTLQAGFGIEAAIAKRIIDDSLRAPGLNVEPVKAPSPNQMIDFIEPPRPGQVPARAPGPPTTPSIDPIPAGATPELRLASALGRVLAVGAEAVEMAAIPLTLGAAGWSDTNMESLNRGVRVSIVEELRKIVGEVNHRLSEALQRQDFSLIREKAPGLFQAALDLSASNIVVAVRLLKLAYGIAVEKFVADAVRQNPFLNEYLDYVAGPSRADFYGKKGTIMGGLTFDVTTQRDIPAHTDPNRRPRYGENVIPIPYLPPWLNAGW